MSVSNKVTTEEENRICDLYINEQLTPSQIGKKVNRDPSTIRRVLKNNNIFMNNINYMSDEELNSIINDYNYGMTIKELSIKYNRSDGYLINKLKQLNVFIPKCFRYEQYLDDICELYKSGNLNTIYEKYPDIKPSSLYSKMSKLGIKCGARNYWSEEDLNIVKENYMLYDIEIIYKMINKRHSIDAIQTLAFKKFGYTKNNKWTLNEEQILINNYQNLDFDKLLELLPNRTKEAIICHAKKFNLISKFYLETYWSQEHTRFLVNNWNKMTDEEIAEILDKTSSSVKERRRRLGLSRIAQDYTGYETIRKLFRGKLFNWKQNSIIACDYKCILTGSENFQIHHLYNFGDIFNEFMKNNSLKSNNISDYSKSELELLCDKFIEFHDSFGLGVCIDTNVHILFHKIYGKHKNTPEQWEKFKNDYLNNKYNNVA